MKQIILLMMLLASVCLQAKQTVLTTYFSVECEAQWGTDTIMIEDDNTITYTITLQNALGVYVRWNAYGDIVLTNQTATSATFYSKGPAKGRISYIYDPASDDPCQFTRNAFIDIYKHFDAEEKYGLTIVGPDCIADGDSVVYSIKPILTTSVNSGIGIDLYNWNIFDATSAPYVQNVSYVSGDSSSVTFKAGTMTGNDSITVRVVLANEEYRLVKHLGHAAPMPIVSDTCLPYDQSSFVVNVYNEDYPNLHYNWTYPANWRIYYIENTYNSQVRLTTTEEGDEATFTVTSSFTGQGNECTYASQASFSLTRSWASSASINPADTIVANNCDFIEFELRDAHLGERSEPKWEKPDTWAMDGEDTHTIFKARPVNSTTYKDSLIVWEDACNHRDSCKTYVYIRPAKADAITDHGCLTVGEEYTFTVESLEVGPTPTGYIWLRGADTLQNSASNSVTFTADAAHQTLTVISKGEYNLLSERATFNLSYNPVPPAGILDTNSCVNFNMPDTLTFSILNPTPNQKYAWTKPVGWTILDTIGSLVLDTCVRMISNGVAGTHTIYAKGVNENNVECSESSSVSIIKSITSVNTEIIYNGEDGYLTLLPRRPTGSDFYWYMLYNGYIVTDGLESDDGRNNMLSDTFMNYFEYEELPQGFTIVFEYTTSDGCTKARVTYGQTISSDFIPLGTTTVQNLANQLNLAPQRKLASNKQLLLFPNPTSTKLNITLSDKSNFEILILDIDGNTMYRSDSPSEEHIVDVSDFPQGNYVVMAKQDRKRVGTNKFIKN